MGRRSECRSLAACGDEGASTFLCSASPIAQSFRLSLDGFGTGYSSLSSLHRLPIDVLKTDRSFVSGMHRHRESQQVVNTILRLAESLGMEVIAEGVEEVQQAHDLAELRCGFGQGYLFAKPLREADADGFIRGTEPGAVLARSDAA